MPVNQPLVDPETPPAQASWELEVTQEINRTESQIEALLQAIQNATDLEDLKTRTRTL